MTHTAAHVQFVPDGQFSVKDLDRFLISLEARWKSKDVLNHEECAEYIGCSVRTLYRLGNCGSIPYHTLQGLGGRLYLKSEIIEAIKSH
jgi:predicted DNA-binding transcriptional regulator AlpA